MKISQLSLATITLSASLLGSNTNAAENEQDPANDTISDDHDISATSSATKHERELQTATAAWHPNYAAGWAGGHCTFTIDINTPSYASELACCNAAYPGQSTGHCLSQLPNPPTVSPTDAGGLDVWYPDYNRPFADAYCINTRPMPPNGSRPTYSTMLACCKGSYTGQSSGKCLSMLPNPPTTSPTGAGGLDVWYADYSIQDYSEGVCINERPLPNGRATYDSQLTCCKAAYGSQMSGKCLSMLPSPPTAAPTKSGGLDVYYPDYTKPYSRGICINDGPLPNGIVVYTSQETCCSSVYSSQSSLACVCGLDNPPAICLEMQAEAELAAAQCLYQRDFKRGPKIISAPGSYKLCEDIVFAPGEPALTDSDEDIANAFDPATVGGSQFDKNEFSLGFFSALVIQSNDVKLLLNGHTIEQGRSHALLQRFFAVIELASSPFLDGVGPADFVTDTFAPAENFILKGPGTIGLSSHHGVHGNNNKNVAISGVTFVDFEVAAVSLNNVKGLTIENCEIPHNRQDVPILGAFSVARQILPFIKALKEASPQAYSMPLRGVQTSSADVYASLVAAIAKVYRDVMETGFIDPSTHQEEYKLFHNIHKVVDGPCYAFLVHGKGPAVGGQGFELSADSTAISSDVKISNNMVKFMKCWTNEIPSVVVDNVVQNDARGGVLALISTVTNEWLASDATGKYTGNIITDAQIMVASAIHDGVLDSNDQILQTQVNTIAQEIVDWAVDPTVTFTPRLRCNGDTMHHVVKGSIMIRVEDTQGFTISDNTFQSASVVSGPGAASQEYFAQFPGTQVSWSCNDYHKGASIEDDTEQQLANLRGISVAAVSRFVDSSKSTISGNTLTNFSSEFANTIVGVDIQGVSEGIIVTGNNVNLKAGVGTDPTDQYIACRVRSYASQGDIVKSNNVLAQEEFFEQVQDRRLRSRRVPDHHPVSVESEWVYGGCPYGNPNLGRRFA